MFILFVVVMLLIGVRAWQVFGGIVCLLFLSELVLGHTITHFIATPLVILILIGMCWEYLATSISKILHAFK